MKVLLKRLLMNNQTEYLRNELNLYSSGDLETLAIVLPGIINTAMMHGVDIRAIFKKFGISMDLKNITQTSINLEVVHAIVMEIEKVSQIPAIGLQTGENFDFDYMPHTKTYLMSSSTLREAYQAINRTSKLVTPILILKLEENDTDAILTLETDVELPNEDERHYVEIVFSTLKTIFSRLLKKDFPTKSVHFHYPESHIRNIYEDFFYGSIVLDAPKNAMIFDRSLLDLPLVDGFPEIHQQARQLIDQELSDSPLQKELAQRIIRIFKKRRDMLNKPIEQVAQCLNMSSRTLQRRLTEKGVNISGLKDQARFLLAVSTLKSGKLSIEDISDNLGYSDRHSFTRAFKRWGGMSPSAFRKKNSK